MSIFFKDKQRTHFDKIDLSKRITHALRNINWCRLADIQAEREHTTYNDIIKRRIAKRDLAHQVNTEIKSFFKCPDPTNPDHQHFAKILKSITTDGDTIEYNQAFMIDSIKSEPSFVIRKADSDERICVDLIKSDDKFKLDIKSAFFGKFKKTKYAYYDEDSNSLILAGDDNKGNELLNIVMKGEILFPTEYEYI